MKRFVGLLMTLVGSVAALWGGYYIIIGKSSMRLWLTDTQSVTALTGGLIGVALFTVGLLWVRD